jgi:anti-sigma regulatory factor (Ser/Thr protein kinase)
MPAPDQITLTLPRDRDFQRVAHLVLGGLAVRLELTIETLEDLQLALSAILDRAGNDGEVTVAMTLRDELARDEGGELGLRRILRAVVDDVQVDGDRVRLTKKVHRNG